MTKNIENVVAQLKGAFPHKTLPFAWITDGTKDFRADLNEVDALLANDPSLRRGRAGHKRTKRVAAAVAVNDTPQPKPVAANNKLFLIHATVRMHPLTAGRAIAQSDQTRIVWAKSMDEAMRKCEEYFDSLSTPGEDYVVLNMIVSEAIS